MKKVEAFCLLESKPNCIFLNLKFWMNITVLFKLSGYWLFSCWNLSKVYHCCLMIFQECHKLVLHEMNRVPLVLRIWYHSCPADDEIIHISGAFHQNVDRLFLCRELTCILFGLGSLVSISLFWYFGSFQWAIIKGDVTMAWPHCTKALKSTNNGFFFSIVSNFFSKKKLPSSWGG